MGLIRTAISTVSGQLSDQWLEVIEPDSMSDTTVMTSGVIARRDDRRNLNVRPTEGTISEGSVIHVYPNQFMILLDGGRIVDYTAEEGYYTFNQDTNPSLFSGSFGDVLKDTWNRVKFGGMPSGKQKVVYINTQEIKGIKFGTRNPINYFDSFYNAELFLRAHGSYSIKIVDPLHFYTEAIPRDKDKVDIADINEQYFNEFMSALQAAINRMSMEGTRISYAPSKSVELSQYMAEILDDDWRENRGFEVQAVGIASISYDEESQKLIHMRNQGAMLGDATIREGYVQGSIARGLESAGSNPGGAMAGFMGMNIANQTAGGFTAVTSQTNQQQAAQQAQAAQQEQQQAAGATQQPTAGAWACPKCGTENTGNFCTQCGTGKPTAAFCPHCGHALSDPNAKFCPNCGKPLQ